MDVSSFPSLSSKVHAFKNVINRTLKRLWIRIYKAIIYMRHIAKIQRESFPETERDLFPLALGNTIKSVRNFLPSISTVTIVVTLSLERWLFAKDMFMEVC